MKGKYIPARPLRRLAWAWVAFLDDADAGFFELSEAIGLVVPDDLWPDDREQEHVRALNEVQAR